jgi:NAD(P)-dependent dehydrogenase (short-subunit alcohol dehydrogenase family)
VEHAPEIVSSEGTTLIRSLYMDTTIAPRLSGKVALVTGGSRGIGAAIAAKLARNGAKAVVNYHSEAETAGRVVEGIVAAGGEAFAVQADVSQVAAAAPLVEAAVQHFGSLDIGHVHQRGGHFVWRPRARIGRS